MKRLFRTESYDLMSNTLTKKCVVANNSEEALSKLGNNSVHYAERVTEAPDFVYIRGMYDGHIIIVYEKLPENEDGSS